MSLFCLHFLLVVIYCIEDAGMRKSPKQVLEEWNRSGMSISEWARANSFDRGLVVYVLNGGAARRGQAHDIAVKLGIKEGVPRSTGKGHPRAAHG